MSDLAEDTGRMAAQAERGSHHGVIAVSSLTAKTVSSPSPQHPDRIQDRAGTQELRCKWVHEPQQQHELSLEWGQWKQIHSGKKETRLCAGWENATWKGCEQGRLQN